MALPNDPAEADPLGAARQAFASGDVLRAVDLLQRTPAREQGTAHHQLLASTLLRAGALHPAREILDSLRAKGHDDEETLGLLAREAKARWQAGEPGALAQARQAYQTAFERTGGTWTGVNAATLALIAGDRGASRGLAEAVLLRLQAAPSSADSSFWHQATCAEVALLLGHLDEALAHYRAARALAPQAWGDLYAMRRNAQAIGQALALPAATLAGTFPTVRVAVFTGHTVDAPGRAKPRFADKDEAAVQQSIEEGLAKHEVMLGVAGAACGADILFLEALQRRGAHTCIVLPHNAEAFRRISVTDIGGAAWGQRFDAVLAACSELILLADQPGEDLSYQFQGAVMAGLARLKAQAIGGDAMGLACWDGEAGGVGGTARVVGEWVGAGLPVHCLPWPGMPGQRLEASSHAHLDPNPRSANGQRVVSMLFADAVGFSKLGEHQVKVFFEVFWGRVADRLAQLPAGALRTANTWGDGLFLVIQDTVAAADLGVELARMAAQTDWAALGLPSHTNLRVALHAGPAYEVLDPVTQRPGFAGTHISRAARIEPVTPPGQVYVSEAFAALLALDDLQGTFHCEYMGSVPLARDYGRFRTYRLVRVANDS